MTAQRSDSGFDPKFKERAKAHDAVDRLREIAADLEAEQQAKERRRDYAVRAVLVILLAVVVVFAMRQ